MAKSNHDFTSNASDTSTALPRATKRAAILGGHVDCYLLEDGRELISGRGAMRGLVGQGPESSGAKDHKLTRLLARLPNEYEALRSGAKVPFILPGGRVGDGITPLQFADIVGAYAALFLAGKLRADQEHIGRNACIIQGAATKLGLSELVSEALGTTRPAEERHRDRLFERLLRHEAGKWEMTFKSSLVHALAPLYGEHYLNGPYPRGLQTPFAMIYEMVFGRDVAAELRTRNADRESNNHQYLHDAGGSLLRNELEIVELLARQSRTKPEFWGRMRSHYLGEPLQLGFN